MANRVTMTICGTEYILVAEEDKNNPFKDDEF